MKRKRERREVWQARVERLRESGLTLAAFAAQEGCHAGTLRQWRYRLERARRPARVDFVEVIQPTVSPAASEVIELVLGRATVRVARGFDGETLARLVAVLESR